MKTADTRDNVRLWGCRPVCRRQGPLVPRESRRRLKPMKPYEGSTDRRSAGAGERSMARFFGPTSWFSYGSSLGIGAEGMRVYNGAGDRIMLMSTGGISLGLGVDISQSSEQSITLLNVPKSRLDSIKREAEATPPMTRELQLRFGPAYKDSLKKYLSQ